MLGRGLLAVLCGVMALAVFAVGCGGGGGGSTQVSASTQVSKATFMKKAEAICKQANAGVQKGYEEFIKEHGGNSKAVFENRDTADEFATSVLLAEKQKQVDGIQELSVPKADQAKVEEILAAYQEGIDVGEENPAQVTSSEGVFKYAAKVAQDFGLRECRW